MLFKNVINLIIVFILSISFQSQLCAQNGIRAFGIIFKPIFPLAVVNTDAITFFDSQNENTLDVLNSNGFSIGGVIRIGLSKRWSVETGLNYVRRNYNFTLNSEDFPQSNASIRFTGYEIPAIAMVFVRLGDKSFMNAGAGITFDLFPTGGLTVYDRDTIEYGMLETNWVIPALTANIGFEYRTVKNGYFYFGTSYHLPFSNVADVFVSYRMPGTNNFTALINPPASVNGTYLTLDIRYYFNSGMKEKRELK